MSRLKRTVAGLLLALMGASSGAADAGPPMPANPAFKRADWWKSAVLYEVYPRSFADSDNDGIGDLAGIDQRLDYLKWLGVDGLWIAPMFASPQVDYGYDVSDFKAVDPQYGTLADMDRLVRNGRRAGINTVLDFVINHTSDQHEWFRQSRSSRSNPYRDFYIWRDPAPNGGPPSAARSFFSKGSSWELDPATGQYYWHVHYKEQPDLNWRNPRVETAMFDVVDWWFRRGVYGFRLDVVDAMFEPEGFDKPSAPADNGGGSAITYNVRTSSTEMHAVLRRLRKTVVDRYPGRMLVGESYSTVPELVKFYGPANDEVHLPMFLGMTMLPRLTAPLLRERIAALNDNAVGGWPTFVLNNHDRSRATSRYKRPEGTTSDDMAKLTGALLLTLRGTPVLYAGEEIGMVDGKAWPDGKARDAIGRDGPRSPMQWDGSANAGFNKGARSWMPVNPDYQARNVASQRRDPQSVLSLYRTLIALRRTHPAMSGDYHVVDPANPSVLAFQRRAGNRTVLVLLNFSDQTVDMPLAGVETRAVRKVIAANRAAAAGDGVRLSPLGLFVADISR